MPFKGPKTWKKPSEHTAFREPGLGLKAVFSLAAESQLVDVTC